MKKTIRLAVAFTCLGFASCKKEHTCECVNTVTNISSSGQVIVIGTANITTTTTVVYKKTTKADMKRLCGNSKWTSETDYIDPNGPTTSISQTNEIRCKLK